MAESIDANGNGKRIASLPDGMLTKRNRQYSDSEPDCPDLDYQYADCDSHTNEMAELYSYTEQPEFHLNLKAFEEQMESYKLSPFWQKLDVETRTSVVYKLLDQLEVSNGVLRMKAARCFLYIVQGCWAEVQSDCEQQHWTRENVVLLYNCGVFPALVESLDMEMEDTKAASNAVKKIALSLSDSTELRVILSIMYVVVEVMRCFTDADSNECVKARDSFKVELQTEFADELLHIKLLRMVGRFCLGTAPHFPIKKVLLLLWKVLLFTLGGMEVLRQLRKEYRANEGLEDVGEDTIEVTRNMRASSPPANAGDLIDVQNQKRTTRPLRKSLMKQSSLDEPLDFDSEGGEESEMRDMEELNSQLDTTAPQEPEQDMVPEEPELGSPRPGTPVTGKGLPWAPKVRNKDLDLFLENTRTKFVGFSLPGDRDTTVGLPQPICEGVSVLKSHIFTSLSEKQIEREEIMSKYPFSNPEVNVPNTPTEVLYEAMLPRLPQYMIALLKVLLAAAPTSKTKTESINIVADVLPVGMPFTMLQSMKLSVDVSRHKEIVVKAVSAILLLLLKHFKLNHIYQFEFISQHLVFANCIPLVLKFLNQNILAYISARNIIPIMDFPTSVIGDQPDLNPDTFDLEIGDNQLYSWRNMFSCINLLRILNKLTKWKHSRIMMLVVFKSAPILKKTLKVRHALLQLYVLKLLKMQTKYLGRQWRKSNMKTLSAIYQKVRHRLNDDWAFGNDLDARPWDFQADECALRTCVDRFNNRRYHDAPPDRDFEPVDTCITSVLGQPLELTEEFKQHYELWLDQEVLKSDVNWDELLAYVTKLVSKLRYDLGRKRRLRNSDGPVGRHNKIRKTITALIKHERIELNYNLCDESRGYIERLISDAIRYGDCHSETMEMANYWIIEKQLVHKLFKVLAPRYQDCPVTYTKMIKAPKIYNQGKAYDKVVLELRNNIYPPLTTENLHNRNYLHNVLLDEARKEFRKEKYAQIAEGLAPTDFDSKLAEDVSKLDLNESKESSDKAST